MGRHFEKSQIETKERLTKYRLQQQQQKIIIHPVQLKKIAMKETNTFPIIEIITDFGRCK